MLQNKIMHLIWVFTALLSLKGFSYTYTYANTTDHTICVEVHGIGGGFERAQSLMNGRLKDIFDPNKKRNTLINTEAGVVTVNNPGFHGKSGPECFPPGYTLKLDFSDIVDAGQCYSLTETQFGVSLNELNDPKKNLDRLTYQFAARPHFLANDTNISKLVQGVSLIGNVVSESAEKFEDFGAIAAAMSLVGPTTDAITNLVRESTCRGFGFTIIDIKKPRCISKKAGDFCYNEQKLYDSLINKGFQNGLNVAARK